MALLTDYLIVKQNNKILGYGNVFSGSDLLLNKAFIGKLGMVKPLIFGRILGVRAGESLASQLGLDPST